MKVIGFDLVSVLVEEISFGLDADAENIDGAKMLGINTIKINKATNILEAINNFASINN